MTTRRKLIITGSLAALGLYSYNRGLRYPRLSFEPLAHATSLTDSIGDVTLVDAIQIEQDALCFRAIAPEPKISLYANKGKFAFYVNNISEDAVLDIQDKGICDLEEEVRGIDRHITIETANSQTINIGWKLPTKEQTKSAVIGDTGGNSELDWCLTRAKSLGAQFLLHLGDFNYGLDDYENAISKFHTAPLPCYISIGNHDFHDSGLIYQQFLRQLGPMNNAFTLNGVRFVNLDTAADFFPAGSGNRGALLNTLAQSPTERQIFFTHRPFRDPRPGQDHTIGGVNEIPWLVNAISHAGGGHLLAGHVHHSTELDFSGLRQYTVGEGLGHEDIVLQRQVARILVGTIEPGRPVNFEWASLNMPWSLHRSHTHLLKLEKAKAQKTIDWYTKLHQA